MFHIEMAFLLCELLDDSSNGRLKQIDGHTNHTGKISFSDSSIFSWKSSKFHYFRPYYQIQFLQQTAVEMMLN